MPVCNRPHEAQASPPKAHRVRAIRGARNAATTGSQGKQHDDIGPSAKNRPRKATSDDPRSRADETRVTKPTRNLPSHNRFHADEPSALPHISLIALTHADPHLTSPARPVAHAISLARLLPVSYITYLGHSR